MDRTKLLRRLDRIEALHDGATTPGEREAAARARERLLGRLADLPSDQGRGRSRTFSTLPHDPSYGLDDAHRRGVRVPDARAIEALLKRWQSGEMSGRSVARWASFYVDKCMLPDHPPEHPGSVPVEVLMALASTRRHPLIRGDIPAMLRFLRTPSGGLVRGWQEWLQFLEGVHRRGRRP